MNKEELQIEQNLTPEALAASLPGAWANHCSGGEWEYYKHLVYIEEKFLEVFRGENKRLIVTVPSQHGKSLYISQTCTSWWLGRRPNDRIILTSYNAEYAAEWGRKSRDWLKEFGPSVFNGIGTDPDHQSAKNWSTYDHYNNRRVTGSMQSIGVGTGLAGRPCDLLICDDYIKDAKSAASPSEIKAAVDWWRGDVQGRVRPNTAIIIIATRWAVNDLIGFLLEEEKRGADKWENVVLSEIAEDDDDPLKRKPGDLLWPEVNGPEFCEQMKINMSDYWWRTNRQGKPYVKGGAVVKQQWFRRYNQAPKREEFDQIMFSIDTAGTSSEMSDYSVIQVWGILEEHKYYLLDLIRDRMNYPELQRTVEDVAEIWRPNVILIENKGHGAALLQHLEEETPHNTEKFNPSAGNKMLLDSESPAIRNGRVYIPEDGTMPWVYNFLAEINAWPNSDYFDQADSLAMALWYFRERARPVELW